VAQLDQVKGVELAVANALWVANDFKLLPEYDQRAQKLLSEARNLDFTTQPEQSRQLINAWVEEKTKHRIRDLLPRGYAMHASIS
jgi:serpin B